MKYNAAGRPVLDLGLGEFDITFLDDVVLYFGTGNDLGIFHDGTDSYIENDTGKLFVTADDGLFFSTTGSLSINVTQDDLDDFWFGGLGFFNTKTEITVFGEGGAGRINSVRINGSFASPTAITSGQSIYAQGGAGWDGSTSGTGTEIRGISAENWSSTANGAYLSFRTTAVGAVGVAERFRVFTNGALVVDGAVGTPAYSFLNDTDCGLYRIGTNNIGIGVAGANVLNIATTGLTVTGLGSFTSTLAWGGGSAITSSNSVALLAASSNTFTGIQVISAAAPRHRYIETGVTANNTTWEWCVDGETFAGRALNDAVSTQTSWLIVNRTANTIDEIELNATTFDFNGTLDVDGVDHDISTSGTFTISGTGETLATFVDDGACTFYHNNTSRIATSATGVDMVAGTFRLFGYTVAGLAALTPNVGETAYVTDALAPAYGVAVVGGGAVVVPVFYNGAAWITA